MLVFFLIGYVLIGFLYDASLMMAFILFFGSVFVTIVLVLMFRLLDTVKARSLDIAETLIGVIDARDPNLNGHSLHVQRLTMLLYKYLPPALKRGIDPISLEYAALMHDVGKLGIPESILNKPAKLTEEEWAQMRQHPEIGVKLLKPLHDFGEIDNWIYCHHERVDGKGYYSILEEDIPLASKIIAVADTYSAITMRRSYKEPRTHEEAIAILQEVAGTQLDVTLVRCFLTIPQDEVLACYPDPSRA
ncbi:MAG: HD domain-containing protein [Clostridia bacterium]|nr:HD domain-containing protein [Clostridia bacterium]